MEVPRTRARPECRPSARAEAAGRQANAKLWRPLPARRRNCVQSAPQSTDQRPSPAAGVPRNGHCRYQQPSTRRPCRAAANHRWWSARELRKPRRLVFGDQSIDDLVERTALHHLVQLIKREVDAMVGHTTLGEIVCPDAFTAIAAADLPFAVGSPGIIPALTLGVVEPRAQDLHRLGLVLVLALLVLLADHDTGRDMSDAHRRVRRVDRLAAGT